MTASAQACQELCTATATVNALSIQAVGVCDYPVSNPFDDVQVTSCTIQQATADAISDTDVLVSVIVIVAFTAKEASSGIPVSAQCETTVSVIVTAATPPATVSTQFPCTIDLTCSARFAGVAPLLTPLDAEEFIITITGTLSCTSCEPAVVNIGLCPSGR